MFEDCGWVEYGAIGNGWVVIVHAEEKMSASATSCLGFIVIPRVSMDYHLHVGGLVCELGMRVGCAVVQELMDAFACGLGWVGLFGGEGTEGNVERAVDSPCIIQQFTEYFLNPHFFVGR